MIGSNNNNATSNAKAKRKHSETHTSTGQEEYDVEIGYDYSLKEKSDLAINEIYIATCSFNYRYHENKGEGALKYDPVTVGLKKNNKYFGDAYDVIQELRLRRCPKYVQFKFSMEVAPAPTHKDAASRKIMVVPSVGCPKSLTNLGFVGNLLWASRAKERPTVLVVHDLEAQAYRKHLAKIFTEYGVGLVSWKCDSDIKGFGISRLAAQQIAYKYSELGAAVLCDTNVVDSKDVANGYESEEEKDNKTGNITRNIYPKAYPIRGTGFYAGAGYGNGIPRRTLKGNKLMNVKGAGRGEVNRPIEQVVIVGDEMLFDPCFITSSEDMDVSNELIFEEKLLTDKKILAFSDFKYRPDMSQPAKSTKAGSYEIAKIEMSHDSLTDNTYMRLRNKYLESLNHEDDIKIMYSIKVDEIKTVKKTTVGKLAQEIADQHSLNPLIIRSLIVEKILLEFKCYERNKAFAECVAYDKKIKKEHPTPSQYWQKVTDDLYNTYAAPSDSENQE